MIIIADAHISTRNDLAPEFFEMLRALESTNQDVAFLGDIFDLWIAFPRYETDQQRAFLAWCREQKTRRNVYFVEGNHEFFLNRARKGAFTAYNDDLNGLRLGDVVFVHGDRINLRDTKYLMFRKLVKSLPVSVFVRFMPCGRRIVHYLKTGLKKTNQNFRKFVPVSSIVQFAVSARATGVTTLFIGHFHQADIIRDAHQTVCLVPDWFLTRQVAVFDHVQHDIRFCHWREAVAAQGE